MREPSRQGARAPCNGGGGGGVGVAGVDGPSRGSEPDPKLGTPPFRGQRQQQRAPTSGSRGVEAFARPRKAGLSTSGTLGVEEGRGFIGSLDIQGQQLDPRSATVGNFGGLQWFPACNTEVDLL